MVRESVLFKLIFLIPFVSGGVFPNFPSGFELEFISNGDDLQNDQNDWWKTASFYQIYPRSFKDSDGDGIGDLTGIREALPYLKEIGITATWLSPIFTSPMADFGYDVANFTEIDSIFGTMNDFDALIREAKQIGIKIILDFVPNHSSDECEWFQKSIIRDPEFEDFYIWHPGKVVNGTRQPPTNWVSVFRGSAWKWNEQRQEYYLHQFVDKQPDLNYRNPKVKNYMNEVLRFWLKKGVSGFRVDAVPHVFEIAADVNGNYLDEPRNDWVTDPDDYGYVDHIYTTNQPETVQLVYEWRKVLDDFRAENGGEERILMIESWSSVDIVMEYYGNGTTEGAQIPFNFLIISSLTNESNAYDYAEVINTWTNKMPKGRTANWVLGNHDKNRVGSRMGIDRIDMLNMLIKVLPGCSVTYQGEEIGMTDVWISWNDTVDPQACNSNPSVYEKMSRDPCRTPFQWNNGKNAGFSNGNKTWLPVSHLYPLVNVKREHEIPNSHLNIYKELQALRSEKVLNHGDFEITAVNDNVLAIKRSLVNEYTFIALLNIMDDVETINLNAIYDNLSNYLEYILVCENSIRRKGDTILTDQILLLPKEAVLLKTTTKLEVPSYYFRYNIL
ncbi:maltase A3-like [Episyrphus balteatus]|uniref:maltase A3-like n=1 Tax=Episyrphus balteatus TaxID=286459 RepID=UPI002486BB76|nr:maltase A3-like [Episyrphus balteatus]XP_055857381.1 maltase A3-like [Episyrphus balteatus]